MKRSAVILAAFVLACPMVPAIAQQPTDVASLLSRAEGLFDRWSVPFDFDAYEADLRDAIASYEEAVPLLDASDVALRARVHNRLAQAYFELGTAYLADDREKEAAFVSGKDHALASLRLDPGFCDAERTSFRDALAAASDPAAVFWYGNNFGSYLNYHQLEAIFGGGARDVPVCYERAAELDETYLGAAPLRSLASYLAQVPAFLGGDLERSRALFERAIAIAPNFLENAVNLAQLVLGPAGDSEAFCATLRDVVARSSDPTAMALWPLYNELSVRKAREALSATTCP